MKVYTIKHYRSSRGESTLYVNLSNYGGSYAVHPNGEWLQGIVPPADILAEATILVERFTGREGLASWPALKPGVSYTFRREERYAAPSRRDSSGAGPTGPDTEYVAELGRRID